MPSSVTTAGLPTHHEFQYIIDRIIKAVPEKPSDVKLITDQQSREGVGIAWNTPDHYCDVEIYKNQIDFTVSADRKHTEFFTTDFQSVDEGIKRLVIALSSSTKTAHN
jgi:hypothetical protein